MDGEVVDVTVIALLGCGIFSIVYLLWRSFKAAFGKTPKPADTQEEWQKSEARDAPARESVPTKPPASVAKTNKYRLSPKPGINAYKVPALSETAILRQISGYPQAQVIEIMDGDSIIAMIGRDMNEIRLDSIDCPEGGQPWGDKAKFGLIKLIGGKCVHLEQHGQDHYGRTLATIYVKGEGANSWLNVNERMIVLGHAWVLRNYFDHLPKERQQKLIRLERWARSKKVGLWRELNPVPPWLWKRNRKLVRRPDGGVC